MRRAIIEVSTDLLRDGLGPLFDAGITVQGSLETPWEYDHVVLLVIAGDILPPECDAGIAQPTKVVTIMLTAESYGRQRIIRVSDVRLTGKTAADYQFCARAA